jgi:murein DD-endopeptidase MepM/ murein hydrolase activator NlpD
MRALLAVTIALGTLVAAPALAASLSVSPASIPQGGTAVLVVTPANPGGVTAVTGRVGSRTVTFFPYGGKWIGFYSAPAKAAPGTYRASLLVNGWYALSANVVIKNAKFPVTKLAVSDELAAQGYNSKTIAASVGGDDSAALLGAAAKPLPAVQFTSAFGYPLAGIVSPATTINVGAFGNYRVSGGVKLQHLGTDLEAASGTPVMAVNDGVVTLTKSLWDYGNTVMVDHGAHIFSLYLHLSGFTVKVGDRVTKGQVIGYVGQTGYALAPHLHLSIWVNGTSIDPLAFIAATQSAMR